MENGGQPSPAPAFISAVTLLSLEMTTRWRILGKSPNSPEPGLLICIKEGTTSTSFGLEEGVG